MTENEAIERLECMRLFMQINDKASESKFLEEDYIANKTAIKVLEEIQQYRAIGTVEECQEARERQRAKKPEFVRVADKNKNQYLCPYCKTGMYHYSDEERKWMNNRFCPKCGQAIDWSDTD